MDLSTYKAVSSAYETKMSSTAMLCNRNNSSRRHRPQKNLIGGCGDL